MEIAFFLLCIICIIILWSKVNGLKVASEELRERIRILESKVGLGYSNPKENKQETPKPIQEPIPIQDLPKPIPPSVTQVTPRVEIKAQRTIPIIAPKSEFWTKVESQLMENWAGILGGVILITGVGFFGTYAYLYFNPFIRVLMILGISIIFLTLSLWLQKQKGLEFFATLLQSIASALFLFATFGSGNIEGICWIDNDKIALFVLVAGIIVNLGAGYYKNKEAFASLHFALSLSALVAAPSGITSLIIGTLVAILVIFKKYYSKWNYHLVVVSSLYFLFHAYQFNSGGIIKEDSFDKISGILCIIIFFGLAHSIHYNPHFYKTERSNLIIGSHILNLFYAAILFLLYSTGSKYSSIFIGLTALLMFSAALYAKKNEIQWLFISDVWTAQGLSILFIFSLVNWGIPSLWLGAIASLETKLFHLWNTKKDNRILLTISGAMQILFSIFFLSFCFISQDAGAGHTVNVWLGIYSSYLILFLLFYLKSNSIFTSPDLKPHSILGETNGILFPLSLIYLVQIAPLSPFTDIIFSLITCALVYLRFIKQINSLAIGLSLFILYMQISFWIEASEKEEKGLFFYLNSIYFLIIYAFTIYYSKFKKLKLDLKFPGIYMASIHICFIFYFLCLTVSSLAFGIICLIFSLLCLEWGNTIKIKFEGKEIAGQSDLHLMILSYSFLVLFLIQHIFVHLQAESILILPVVSWIQIFAILVLFYHLYFHNMAKYPILHKVHPFFAEAILVFLILVLYRILQENWHPVAWAVLTLPLYFASRWKKINLLHFRSYALIAYLLNCIIIAFLFSAKDAIGISILEIKWISTLLAFFIQVASLIVIFRTFKEEPKIDSKIWPKLGNLEAFFLKQKMVILFYPLYISVFLFLYWYSAGGYLTLLWTVLAFSIFILSLVFREDYFRYVSSVIILFCVIRLIFFDLAKEGTIIKAVVFFSVGLILLVMNYLYNRFKMKEAK